ncbi:PAS-domain containing protein [Azospirillum sp. sgz301742]
MTGAGMARFDAHGRLIWASPAFADSLGASGDLASGNLKDMPLAVLLNTVVRDGTLTDPEGRSAFDIVRRLSGGAMAVLCRRGGVWVALTLVDDGEGGRLLSVARTDVPETAAAAGRLRALQERQAVLETAFDTMVDAIAGFDRDLRLVLWNRNYFDLSRLPHDAIRVGTRFEDIVRAMAARGDYGPVDVESFTVERVAAARRNQPFHFQFTLWGDTVFDARHLPLPDGGFLRRYVDITDRARAEESVRTAKEQAEEALHDLKQAQAHLIQSEKMASLGALVAGVAHEINTPVGIALTGASLLAERMRDVQRAFDTGRLRKADFADYMETAAEASQIMMLNIERAAQLIQSFKQMAVDQASEERRSFDLRDYIHEVLRSLGVRLKRAAHRVEVDCPDGLVLDGYPGALSQLLTNLVMNSLTHAYEPGEHGCLRIAVRRLDGDGVELVYSDDGRGIPAELHTRVFDPFFTTSRRSGGSGLGLNIVYNIATRSLKGRIALDSAPGQGAVFTVTFPRVVEPESLN